jgi:hypothetical protein
MRKSGGIDQDKVHAFATRGMDAINQFVLGIALQVQQMVAGFTRPAFQIKVDLFQGHRPVDARFAGAKQVQVGSVKNQKGRHRLFLVIDVGASEPGDYAAKPL